MKQTLLGMTQSILSSLNSDEVNSISDTPESLQVAEIVRQTYFNIISRLDITDHEQLVQLQPSLEETQPVIMYVPDGVSNLIWLKYFNSNVLDVASGTSVHGTNTNLVATPSWSATSVTSITIGTGLKVFTLNSSLLPIVVNQAVTIKSTVTPVNAMTGTVSSYVGGVLTVNVTSFTGSGTFAAWTLTGGVVATAVPGYQYVTILPIAQFLDMTNSFNPSESNVLSFTFEDNSNNYPGNFTFYYKNDKQPQYCTVLSNFYVIFDGYDNSQDSTLQTSKTMAMGKVIPTFTMVDSFTPNLSDEQFTLLLNEAKSLAYFELKQSAHPKAEQEAKRGWSSIQKTKSVVNRPTYFDALPNFGRRGYRNTSFFKMMGWDRSNG